MSVALVDQQALAVAALVGLPGVDLDAELQRLATPGLGFPTPDLVHAVAGLFVRQADQTPSAVLPSEGALAEGRHFVLGIAAGVVALRAHDHERAQRTAAKSRVGSPETLGRNDEVTFERYGDDLPNGGKFGFYGVELGEDEWSDTNPQRVVTHWSRRSRARMTRRLMELDYAPLFASGRPVAMLTLTYPGDWLAVAPSGKAVKKHLRSLSKRWARKYGAAPAYLWKLEFQGRGAPHFHLFAAVEADDVCEHEGPCGCQTFRGWLSRTWADLVGADDLWCLRCKREGCPCDRPDTERRRHRLAGTGVDFREGVRASDPKRLAVYFSKHGGAAGGKEYQHAVPEAWQTAETGPGRFWGYSGVERVTAEVYMTQEAYVRARRALRRWSRAQGFTRSRRVPRGVRVDLATGEVSTVYRTVHRPVRYLATGGLDGGFVLVNDGPALAASLSRDDRMEPRRRHGTAVRLGWLP